MKLYIIGIIMLSVLITSCDKELDLEPSQSVSENLALSNDANVKKVLNGAYDAISSSNLYGGNLQLFSELLAADGEIRWEGTFNQPREVWQKAMITTNSFVANTWIAAYNTINIANNIIGAIDVVNADDQNRVKGEALYLRAAIYFELVKLYAKPYSAGSTSNNKGLPLVLTPTRGIDESSYVPRSSVEETYTRIITDLVEAEGLLPEVNPGASAANRFIYATKAAAAAQLSRVYLQMERWADARDAVDRAITSATANGRSLSATYAGAFNNAAMAAEYIFAMIVSAQDGANNMHLYWSIPAFGGRDGDVSIDPSHLALYSATDARLALFYIGAGETRSGKWRDQYRVLPVIRLAELYLTRAEANFRAGTSIGSAPVDDVNRTRQRAGLTALGSVTLDDILLERKLELAHEGQGAHDLKRLRQSADGFTFDADEMVFPIPQRDIDASRNVIVQNDGY